MARRSRAPSGIRRTHKRDTFWTSSIATAPSVLAANSVNLFTLFTNAQMFSGELVDHTIIRTRGFIGVQSDQVGTSESGMIALGIILQNERARVAGAAAVPTPIVSPDAGWFVYGLFPWMSRFADATGIVTPGQMFEIDSKAMRKVDGSDSVVLVVDNASAAFGCDFIFGFHFLVKLG